MAILQVYLKIPKTQQKIRSARTRPCTGVDDKIRHNSLPIKWNCENKIGKELANSNANERSNADKCGALTSQKSDRDLRESHHKSEKMFNQVQQFASLSIASGQYGDLRAPRSNNCSISPSNQTNDPAGSSIIKEYKSFQKAMLTSMVFALVFVGVASIVLATPNVPEKKLAFILLFDVSNILLVFSILLSFTVTTDAVQDGITTIKNYDGEMVARKFYIKPAEEATKIKTRKGEVPPLTTREPYNPTHQLLAPSKAL